MLSGFDFRTARGGTEARCALLVRFESLLDVLKHRQPAQTAPDQKTSGMLRGARHKRCLLRSDGRDAAALRRAPFGESLDAFDEALRAFPSDRWPLQRTRRR